MRLKVDTQLNAANIISEIKKQEVIALLRVIKGNESEQLITDDESQFEDVLIQKLNDIYSYQLKQEQKSTHLLASITHLSKGDFTQRIEEPSVDKDNLDLIQKGVAQLGRKLQENAVKSDTFDVLFNTINIPFMLLNVLDRTISRLNTAAIDFFHFDTILTHAIPSYKLLDESLMTIIDSFYLFESESFTFEHTFVNSKGKQTIVHISKVNTIFDHAEQIAIFITDISVQKENEFKNKERAIQERSLKLKAEFLNAIDMEMKGPLQTITSLLPEHKFLEFQAENIPALLTSNMQLKQAIENIQMYNTAEQQAINSNKQDVRLLSFVEQLLQAHYFHAIANNVFLDYTIDKQIEMSYFVDSLKLKLVINNLVANALKFCKNGTIRVSMDLISDNLTSSLLQFTVFDSRQLSEGESAFSIENVYNHNQNNSLSGVESAGLGIIVSVKMVEYLGGKLSYAYEPSVGSKFTFELLLNKVLH